MRLFTRAMLEADEKDDRRSSKRPVDKPSLFDTSATPVLGIAPERQGHLRPDAVLRLQQTHGNQYVQRLIQAQRTVSQGGETLEGEDDPNAILGGEIQRQPGDGPDAGVVALDAPAVTASLHVTTKEAPVDLGCGGYRAKRQWSIDNGGVGTNGFVVQKVNFNTSQLKCDGADDTTAVTPVYWEAWQVRDGKVFIGTTNDPHVADTFSHSRKPNHKGKNAEKGAAKYIDGYTEPTKWGHDAPEAGALPTTTSQPAGWSDSGTITCSISETFDCCDGKDEKKLESAGF
jgi:hypothetical protein